MRLQEIIKLMHRFSRMDANQFAEESDGIRVEIRKYKSTSASPPAPEGGALPKGERIDVAAPVDGLFYHLTGPAAPVFVQPGDRIGVGQLVGMVEVMKMAVDVRSPAYGIFREYLAGNGEPVSAGQPVVALEVSDSVGSYRS